MRLRGGGKGGRGGGVWEIVRLRAGARGGCVCVGGRTYLGVHLEGEHDLGRAVPPRRDVLGHQPRAGLLAAWARRRARAAREAEVAHLEVAVGVQEEVGGLEVAVDDVRAVHRLERTERLVHEVLFARDPGSGIIVDARRSVQAIRIDQDAVSKRRHERGGGVQERWGNQ